MPHNLCGISYDRQKKQVEFHSVRQNRFLTVTIRDYPTPHHTSWQKIAKDTKILHIRYAILNQVFQDDFSYHTHITGINKNINFRSISGVRNFENFISDFRSHHQKMQNLILRGVIRGIFKCLKSRFLISLAKNCQLVW